MTTLHFLLVTLSYELMHLQYYMYFTFNCSVNNDFDKKNRGFSNDSILKWWEKWSFELWTNIIKPNGVVAYYIHDYFTWKIHMKLVVTALRIFEAFKPNRHDNGGCYPRPDLHIKSCKSLGGVPRGSAPRQCPDWNKAQKVHCPD